eukprot:CAMPEP_0170535908 /NCGR_PEP_ID=MMETSP0209-20121228/101858_1 /TAXON_ID=665100 ORGANISM="Litonotus pictus, Strain P1" /NCGR_SAMPLE_ID=MMETSP0209 /ASSEMBLY_ACC=CAM_ASM_000301 /LENGTH=99 /DNA_ID=CAMNT_0010837219 /DNA_START=785 /DNA_END=1084 /DNA_ORIENTATION=-
MKKALEKGISNIASFGLATGIPNKASAPHSIANSFKTILGLSAASGVEIKQAKGLTLSAPTAAPVKVEKKEEPKKKEEKKKVKEPEPEEDDDGGFGGLF